MKEKVIEFLGTRKLMALATSDEDMPWICNVYYVIDEDLNFYFKSSLETIHIQQILKNNKVAVTVTDSNQKPTDRKVAVQLNGFCTRVTQVDKINWFLNKWSDTPSKYDPTDLASGNISGVFKIIPNKLKYFDTELIQDNNHFVFIKN